MDDVDDYIRTEELNYSKVTKCKPKKSRPPVASQDDLARKDGLDKSCIIGSKRRRSHDATHDEDGPECRRDKSSPENEPESKRKKLSHAPEINEADARSPKKEHKFKSALPPGLKGTMDRAAEDKYNSMINLLFGPSSRKF